MLAMLGPEIDNVSIMSYTCMEHQGEKCTKQLLLNHNWQQYVDHI